MNEEERNTSFEERKISEILERLIICLAEVNEDFLLKVLVRLDKCKDTEKFKRFVKGTRGEEEKLKIHGEGEERRHSSLKFSAKKKKK